MIFTDYDHHGALFLIVVGSGISVIARKLTLSAALTGALLALIIYLSAGYTGLFMLSAFFVTGIIATSWKKEKKQRLLASGNHQEKRTTTQVLANAAVPALTGLLVYIFPGHTEMLLLMIAGSLASATADTLSSELGMIYGRRFYNIISFKKEAPGLDGVVSLEGTLAGFAGAVLIALIYALGYSHFYGFWIIVVAGTAGNIIDSLLGAVPERRGLLTNDLVNFFNTISAAAVCVLLWFIKNL